MCLFADADTRLGIPNGAGRTLTVLWISGSPQANEVGGPTWSVALHQRYPNF